MYNVDDKITFKIEVDNEIVSFTGKIAENVYNKYYLSFYPNHSEICKIIRKSISALNDIAEVYDGYTNNFFPVFDTLELLELFINVISIEASKE